MGYSVDTAGHFGHFANISAICTLSTGLPKGETAQHPMVQPPKEKPCRFLAHYLIIPVLCSLHAVFAPSSNVSLHIKFETYPSQTPCIMGVAFAFGSWV